MRACIRCGTEIDKCMGFVLARDWLSATDGVIPWSAVREHCGICANKIGERELSELPAFPVSF